jgi:hypothetical protein
MASKKTPPQAWFRNPTMDTVLHNEAVREHEKQRQAQLENSQALPPFPQKPQPFVYIASPYRGDTDTNVSNALKYCRYALEEGKFPIAPHAWLPRFLDDDNPAERELALKIGIWLLAHCKEVWVFGDTISEGMKGEIATAKQRRISLCFFTDAEIKERGILR